MLSARTTWSVEDNWITLGGLGDPMLDLIASASDPDEKVRLAAVINIGRRAMADTSDKRPLPVLLERLADKSSPIRLVAAAAVGIPGLVDATVDPCYRNRLIATLQVLAEPKIEPSATTRERAANSVKTLLELGMLDPSFLPIAEKCGIVRPGPPIDIGPFVDPTARAATSSLSTGEKLLIAGAAASVIGVIAYAILGSKA